MATSLWNMPILVVGMGLAALTAPAGAQESLDTTASIPEPLLTEYARAVLDNWVWYGGGFKQNYWLLPKTVRRTPRGTSTCWTVNIQAVDSTGDWTSARAAIIAARKRIDPQVAGYETYVLTKVQFEVDCVQQRARVIQLLDYDEDGNVIYSGKTREQLEEPVPDTNGENLLRVFCHPKLRRTFLQLMAPK